MNRIKASVLEFLDKYQMDYLNVDIEANIKAFLDEMQKGLDGQKSSLEMIPTYIEVGSDVPSNKPVIVIDAGGTNFRVASVRFDEQKPVVENLKKYQMPGTMQEVGKDEFFRMMAEYVREIAGVSENIGFCFSYPSEILPNKDGRLIRFTKEVKAKDVVGQLIGENLNRAIAEMKTGGDKHIVILNDTAATLLAGVGHNDRIFGGYLGFILGTGTNCCYVEKNGNIKKKKELDLQRSQIINAESANFSRCQRGEFDKEFDKTTANPGEHIFEKMISGAYLGAICFLTIQKACNDGLFSSGTAEVVSQMRGLETKQLNDFMFYPYGENPLAIACKTGDSDDVVKLYYLAGRMIERAAKLAAINLSAMAIKSGCDTRPDKPLCIVAEGTTFYQMKGLKSKVEFYLKQYLENEIGIYWEIISVDNAALIGAAIAGLTN
ncbi:MAG: hexokinase family protein [Sedimentisphaerales bacterium]